MEQQAVDMVDQARQNQIADSRLEPGEIRLIAPAKVNLFLDIGQRRPDGYHDATSIMHALMLHDVLRMKLGPSDPAEPAQRSAPEPEGAGAVEGPGAAEGADAANGADDRAASHSNLKLDVVSVAREGLEPLDVPAHDNIAARAVRLLAKLIGRDVAETMRIIIEKHIPAQAGLGGGSSDAAAALLGAAHLWGLATDDPRIEEAARQLGADVAFFLHGGCACFTGVGDAFHHRLAPMSHSVALIKPEGGVSTKDAYKAFDQCPQAIEPADRDRAFAATDAGDVPLRNNLVCASELLLPALQDVRTWVRDQGDGVVDTLMSGSGSAVFVVCRDFQSACRIVAGASARGWWARTTAFGPARAAVVPTR